MTPAVPEPSPPPLCDLFLIAAGVWTRQCLHQGYTFYIYFFKKRNQLFIVLLLSNFVTLLYAGIFFTDDLHKHFSEKILQCI